MHKVFSFIMGISILSFLFAAHSAEAGVEEIEVLRKEVGNDRNKTYWLLIPTKIPKDGFGLIVILAGGDGDGEKVIPFWKNVATISLQNRYIVALPVAPKWDKEQIITWPTKEFKDIVKDMKFTTEEFISELVNEATKGYKINSKHVWLHGISSGGPAVYAISLSTPGQFKGYYILSSVFKPERLPSLSLANGKRYYIQHSQEDKICPFWMAKKAAFQLGQNGAITELDILQGPHGYPFKEGHPDWEKIEVAFRWLEGEGHLSRLASEPSLNYDEDK